MEILAVLVGLAVGGGLALAVGLPLRRRQRAQRAAGASAPRRSILGTPAQRVRALWMAVAIAAGALVAAAAGGEAIAGTLLLMAILLSGQSALFAVIARLRDRRH